MTTSTELRPADVQELSALAAAISGAVIRLGSDRRVQSWSDSARELFGLEADEILGLGADALMDPSGRPQYLAALAHVVETGMPARIETTLLRRCGTAFPASVELGAITGTAGEQAGWVTITRDLSGERDRVAALLEWKARYEAAIKVSGMILRDWKPEEDQVTCAGNVEAILGEPIVHLKGGIEGWAELIHPEDREAFFQEF